MILRDNLQEHPFGAIISVCIPVVTLIATVIIWLYQQKIEIIESKYEAYQERCASEKTHIQNDYDEKVKKLRQIIAGTPDLNQIDHLTSQVKQLEQTNKDLEEQLTRLQKRTKAQSLFMCTLTPTISKTSEFRMESIKTIQPLHDRDTVKQGATIVLAVDIANPQHHEVEIKWESSRGVLSHPHQQITFYTAPKIRGGDNIFVEVLDKNTRKKQEQTVIINVTN